MSSAATGIDPAELEHWDFSHFLVQPMDCERREEAIEAAIRLAMERPKWRLSLQAQGGHALGQAALLVAASAGWVVFAGCGSATRPARAGRGRLAGRPADGRSVDARF